MCSCQSMLPWHYHQSNVLDKWCSQSSTECHGPTGTIIHVLFCFLAQCPFTVFQIVFLTASIFGGVFTTASDSKNSKTTVQKSMQLNRYVLQQKTDTAWMLTTSDLESYLRHHSYFFQFRLTFECPDQQISFLVQRYTANILVMFEFQSRT